jgi:hypothetical protein
MRKLIFAALALAPGVAQAGYLDRVPTDNAYHYDRRDDPMPRDYERPYQPPPVEQKCISIPLDDGRSVIKCR